MGYLKRAGHFIRKWYHKDKKILSISICGGLLVTMIAGVMATKTYSETIQSGIANSVIRFHVLANSDSEFDQNLKLKVRDAVLEKMSDSLSGTKSKEETKLLLEKAKSEIKNTALEVIKKEGFQYDVNVTLSNDLFPMKVYGDIAFPAGYYDALRIEIGNADGQNWWCVMFPPLCFVEGSYETVSDKSKKDLENILTEDEYEIVVTSKSKEAFVPEIKFKVVEWWQEREADESKYATKK